jgi:OFA family oxalate/formate antiporter-like MFS transporter
MKNKALIYLFISNFSILFVGMGVFPILPLYATEFGANPGMVGIYLALTYVAISSGTILTGYLSRWVSRRYLLALSGVLGAPAIFLMGQATALWQVMVLTGVIWFTGGIGLATVSVLTGLVSDQNRRGKSFSLMSLGTPLGAILGGTATSQLLAWGGYSLAFSLLSVVWIAIPLSSLLGLKNNPVSQGAVQPMDKAAGGHPGFGWTFYALLIIAMVSGVAVNVIRMGTSMSMQALDFSPSAVASTSSVSGLLAMPVVFLMGVLSDRFGRKGSLMLAYLLAAVGAVALLMSTQLWHFWLAATFILVSRTVNEAVGSAFATDILSAETLNRGIPWLRSMSWVSGVVSFTGSGYVIQAFGQTTLYLVSAALAVFATVQLYRLTAPRPEACQDISKAGEWGMLENCFQV